MNIFEIKKKSLNNVYIVDNGDKYICHLSNFDNNFECRVLDLLRNRVSDIPHFCVGGIVDTKFISYPFCEDFELYQLDSALPHTKKYFSLMKYIEGDTISHLTNDNYIELARILRNIHTVTFDFEPNSDIHTRESKDKLREYIDNVGNAFGEDTFTFMNNVFDEISDIDFDRLDSVIVHGDVKPDNMLVGTDSRLKLIDFGNAFIGTRLIDVIRVIMWCMLHNDRVDYESIDVFCKEYFISNKMTNYEKKVFDKLFRYCLLYNFAKDKSLCVSGDIPIEYVETTGKIWYKYLNEKNVLDKIKEIVLCN